MGRAGALAAVLTAAGALAAGVVRAQERPAEAQQSQMQQSQAGRTASFDIPAQPLAQALTALGQQAGLQIAVSNALVAGKTSTAVSGVMTAEQALRQLLAGTGVAYRFTSANAVTVSAAGDSGGLPPGVQQLDPVQVQGYPVPPQAMIDNLPPPYAGGQVATGGQLGLLGNRPVMDTPFNQTNYTAKKAQDQQAQTVVDVLIDDPSLRLFRQDTGLGSSAMYIRGFPVDGANFAYGGLYGMLPNQSVAAELAERVEVLKGPSAMLAGMAPGGSIGGLVNIVPKRAANEDLYQVTANYRSAGQFGGHADIGRRFGPDKELGVRFNGVYKAGQTDVQWNTSERALALLGLDFRAERVRLSADLGYSYQNIGGVMPNLGVANGVQLPWAPSVRSNPGAQAWNELWAKDLFGVARAEFDVTERITAYAAFGAHDFRFSGLYSPTITATNFYGAATTQGPQNTRQWRTFLTAEAGIRGVADTGIVEHEFALIGTTYYQDFGLRSVSGSSYASNFYYPTAIARPSIPTPDATKSGNITLSSLALADTLSLADKRIQLTLGARLQQVQSTNFNATTGALTSGYSESALSPSVALVFKPWQNVSVYGNWIQGLQQGTIVGQQYTNAGEVFPPFKSTQYEAGIKVDWGKFTTTASVFQISQPSVIEVPGLPLPSALSLNGEQRNQGLELNFFGEPIEGVRLLGGAMLLNAVLTKTQGGVTDGWIAPNSPGVQLNLAGEWDLPFVRGLTLNGRVIYTGSQYIDTTWPRRSLPEWTRFDLGAWYAFDNPGSKGKLLVARFNVDNVLDANYWAGGFFGGLILGQPRTFRLSLTADF